MGFIVFENCNPFHPGGLYTRETRVSLHCVVFGSSEIFHRYRLEARARTATPNPMYFIISGTNPKIYRRPPRQFWRLSWGFWIACWARSERPLVGSQDNTASGSSRYMA